jgi:hypothetical protein
MCTKSDAGLFIVGWSGRIIQRSHTRDRELEVVVESGLIQVEGKRKYPHELHSQGQDVIVVPV